MFVKFEFNALGLVFHYGAGFPPPLFFPQFRGKFGKQGENFPPVFLMGGGEFPPVCLVKIVVFLILHDQYQVSEITPHQRDDEDL